MVRGERGERGDGAPRPMATGLAALARRFAPLAAPGAPALPARLAAAEGGALAAAARGLGDAARWGGTKRVSVGCFRVL